MNNTNNEAIREKTQEDILKEKVQTNQDMAERLKENMANINI